MTTIRELLAPQPTDTAYTQTDSLAISLICRMDSYKFGHPFAFPDEQDLSPGEKIVGMTSYGSARVPAHTTIVPAGMQILAKRYLTQRITMADIDAAEKFSSLHFGARLFNRAGWEKVVTQYNGYLPLTIRAVAEGTPIRGGDAIYTVTCLDEDLFWMSAGFETLIQRAVWYPTTIATMDYSIKREIKHFYEISAGDMNLLPFALHDFGGRGVTSPEQAEIGGAAHLFNFMGSDTVEGVITANWAYKETMSAFSVYATEHSVQCSYGRDPENQIKYIRHQIRKARELGLPIVSIVLDGYDVYREAKACCTELRDDIVEFGKAGGKVVFRPDSGDMMEVVPQLLRMQEQAFGYEYVTGKFGNEYRRIKYVGIIQGDGVDHMSIKTLLGNIVSMGYSASCVIFGSGGALLQKVNRDTFKFAQKACAILVRKADGTEEWRGIAKDPVTDPGKKSKEGVLTLVRSRVNNELMTVRIDIAPLNSEYEDLHKVVYHNGTLYNETTLAEIRQRLA